MLICNLCLFLAWMSEFLFAFDSHKFPFFRSKFFFHFNITSRSSHNKLTTCVRVFFVILNIAIFHKTEGFHFMHNYSKSYFPHYPAIERETERSTTYGWMDESRLWFPPHLNFFLRQLFHMCEKEGDLCMSGHHKNHKIATN